MKKLTLIFISFILVSCASTSTNKSNSNCSSSIFYPCDDDVKWVSDNIYYRKDGTKIVIVNNTSYLKNDKLITIASFDSEQQALNNATARLEQIANRKSKEKSDNSDVWLALLILLNDSWNPKKPQIDKALMDELSSDLFKDYYSNPNESMINTPLTKGLYSYGLYLSEFMIRDLITGKVYKGRWNLTGEKVLFDNGMTGKFDSMGNFIFSNF